MYYYIPVLVLLPSLGNNITQMYNVEVLQAVTMSTRALPGRSAGAHKEYSLKATYYALPVPGDHHSVVQVGRCSESSHCDHGDPSCKLFKFLAADDDDVPGSSGMPVDSEPRIQLGP